MLLRTYVLGIFYENLLIFNFFLGGGKEQRGSDMNKSRVRQCCGTTLWEELCYMIAADSWEWQTVSVPYLYLTFLCPKI